MVNIDKLIKKLLKDNETNDPFKIAKNLGINLIYEDLGTLNGYYNTVFRHKLIHINSNLTENQQRFTVAHELGHALLHPDVNTAFLKTHTYMVINKFENEANEFAIRLLIRDEDLEEFRYLHLDNIAYMCGCNENLIRLRLDF